MAITVNSDFWGNNYSFIRPKSYMRRGIARLLSQLEMRADREVIRTLLGVPPGAQASDSYKRIAHSRTELGGKRAMETDVIINRPTTAADVLDIDAGLLTYRSNYQAYPVDKATKP